MISKNESLTLSMAELLANDIDPDGDTIVSTVFGEPAHGVLTFNKDGSLVYTPDIGFVGTDVFTYQIEDNLGALSNTATVRITVTGSNDQVLVSLITDPWDSAKTALRVIGTDQNDTIQFTQQGNGLVGFRVTVNNVSE